MTYIIGAAVTAIAFAIFTGMRIDKFYYNYTYGSSLDTDIIYGHSLIGVAVIAFWPLALGAAIAAVPLYGAFLLGKKLSARKNKTEAK
jgi:hypothetical protein